MCISILYFEKSVACMWIKFLNKVECSEVLKAKDYFIEMNKGYAPEVVTGIARIGGMAVGAIVFGGEDKGVELDRVNVAKIK